MPCAAAALVVFDADIIGAGFREAVREHDLFGAAVFAEGRNDVEVGVENGDDRLQGGADQHRAVVERELLAGFHLNLEIVDVAGAGNRARQNRRQESLEGVFRRVVRLLVGGFAVIGFDQEAAFGAGAERRQQAEAYRADLGVGRDIDLDGHLVARRQGADIDGRGGAVRAKADIGQIGQFLHAQDAAGDAGLAEIDGAGFGEIEAFDGDLDGGAARDADGGDRVERRRSDAVAGGLIGAAASSDDSARMLFRSQSLRMIDLVNLQNRR